MYTYSSMKIIAIYFLPDLRNLRRNLSEEIYHSGWTRTLSWIFNWKVPKVAHPSPVDVALNNYSHYATKIRSNHHHRRKSSQFHEQSKWSRRKRKPVKNKQQNQLTNQQDIMSQHYLPHQPPTPPSFPQISQRKYEQHQQLSFQQRKSSSISGSGGYRKSQHNSQQPYVYEPPLSYYDASQVYFYPSQKSS